MSIFGLNILQQQRDSGRLFPYLARLKPHWCVVQDEHKLAASLRSVGCGVIFRAYRPDDARLHETMTPAQFIEQHRAFAAHSIVVQVLNEPVVQSMTDCKKLVTWLLEVIHLANAINMRLCVANFAMGNPHERLIEDGAFDPLLEALGTRHLLGLHEYAQRGNVSEGWLIGRYRHWFKRAAHLQIRNPEIVITECGFDIGGGHGDGWRAHMGAEAYAALLRQIGRIYAVDGVEACVYSWGDGFSWSAFNIEGEQSVMDALIEINASAQAPAPEPTWVLRRIVLSGLRVNIRQQPTISATARTFEATGAVIDWASNRDTPDASSPALHWQMVRIGGEVGWVRSDAASLVEVLPPAPPPPPPPAPLPVDPLPDIPDVVGAPIGTDELQNLIGHHLAIAQANTAIVAIYRTVIQRMEQHHAAQQPSV